MSMGDKSYEPRLRPAEPITLAVCDIPTLCRCIWVMVQMFDGAVMANLKYVNNVCGVHYGLERVA
jgi:hypothetical protein